MINALSSLLTGFLVTMQLALDRGFSNGMLLNFVHIVLNVVSAKKIKIPSPQNEPDK